MLDARGVAGIKPAGGTGCNTWYATHPAWFNNIVLLTNNNLIQLHYAAQGDCYLCIKDRQRLALFIRHAGVNHYHAVLLYG